jgi:putative endonuclease
VNIDYFCKNIKKQHLWKELEYCVYYEYYPSIEQAIERETQLKKWRRVKKELLITKMNPEWNDLWEKIRKWIY